MHQQNNNTQSTATDAQSTWDNHTKETAEKVKQKTSQAIDEVKEQSGEMAAEAKTKAEEMTAEVKHQAGAVIDDAKRQATEMATERKEDVSQRLHGVASALRDSSQQFEKRQESTFADYVNTAADQVEQFAGYLETRDMGEIVQGARDMARRQPELFVVGSLAAGFFLGRFLKSTQSRANQHGADPTERHRRSYPADWRNSYNSYRGDERADYERYRYLGDYRPERENRWDYDDRRENGGRYAGERREYGGLHLGEPAARGAGVSYGGATGRNYSKAVPSETASSDVETPHDVMHNKGADAFNGQRSINSRSVSETAPGAGPDWSIGKERSEPTDPQRTHPSKKGGNNG